MDYPTLKKRGKLYVNAKIRKLHFNHKLTWYAVFGGGTMPKILVVEDDFDIQELLQNFLQVSFVFLKLCKLFFNTFSKSVIIVSSNMFYILVN